MSKARFNKFIFQGGKTFLRLKTLAKDLKVKKQGTDYSMEVLIGASQDRRLSIPVVCLDKFQESSSVIKDLVKIDCVIKDDERSVSESEMAWGWLKSFTDKENMIYYYLEPAKKTYAIRVGPIPKDIDGSKIEIDWTNLQWGTE